jgi:hypothetical protein
MADAAAGDADYYLPPFGNGRRLGLQHQRSAEIGYAIAVHLHSPRRCDADRIDPADRLTGERREASRSIGQSRFAIALLANCTRAA